MSSTLILGSDRVAHTLAKFLCSSGEKVCLLGSINKTKAVMTEMIQNEVERDFPFQFVDDIKCQEHYLKKRMENIRFCNHIEDVGNLKAVVVTESDLADFDIASFGSVPVANFDKDTLNYSNYVDVKPYPPLEITKMAQIIIQPSTDPIALSCIRALLEKAGIQEITSEQADTANEMLRQSSHSRSLETSPVSSMNDVIFSLFPQRKPIDHAHAIMH